MVEFTPLRKTEIESIVTQKAQKVIDETEMIDEDTKIEIRNGVYFDSESLLSFEAVISDEYVYDWEQIRGDTTQNVTNPIETAKLKGLQKLHALTWEEIQK